MKGQHGYLKVISPGVVRKTIHPEVRNRQYFLSEVHYATIAGELGIGAKVYSSNLENYTIDMEYLEGYQVLPGEKFFALDTLMTDNQMKLLVSHLEKIHKLGWVHGDLNCFNIMTNGSDLKLVDFDRADSSFRDFVFEISRLKTMIKFSKLPALETYLSPEHKECIWNNTFKIL